jgi:hypothetical protein
MYNFASAAVVYGMFKRLMERNIKRARNNAKVTFCGNLMIDGT